MASKVLLCPSLLRQLLRYEPGTGRVFWLARGPEWFKDESYAARRKMSAWNGRFSGKEALTAVHCKGYLHGCVLGQQYLAHRVIWAIVNDFWPEQVDHINGNPADNRIANLRNVESRENQRNMKRPHNNTSGCTGVVWHRDRGKWAAQITVNQRNVHLGRFDDFYDAVAARKAAEVKYGFHSNHGRGIL